MNMNLLQVYGEQTMRTPAIGNTAAQRNTVVAEGKNVVQQREGAHTFCVRPDELKTLLSDDEKTALESLFTSGNSMRLYEAAPDAVRLKGNAVDITV